jgi:hypothetical protein
MHIKGGVSYLVEGSEMWQGCSRSHSEVDAHCLVSRQVSFSRGNGFGRFWRWLMHVNSGGSRFWVENGRGD